MRSGSNGYWHPIGTGFPKTVSNWMPVGQRPCPSRRLSTVSVENSLENRRKPAPRKGFGDWLKNSHRDRSGPILCPMPRPSPHAKPMLRAMCGAAAKGGRGGPRVSAAFAVLPAARAFGRCLAASLSRQAVLPGCRARHCPAAVPGGLSVGGVCGIAGECRKRWGPSVVPGNCQVR